MDECSNVEELLDEGADVLEMECVRPIALRELWPGMALQEEPVRARRHGGTCESLGLPPVLFPPLPAPGV